MSRLASGAGTTELKQLELPAISLTGPGAVTPAPIAHAMLSPAPAITGVPGSSLRRRARAGRRPPMTLHEDLMGGSVSGSRSRALISSLAHVRWLRSRRAVAAATVQ